MSHPFLEALKNKILVLDGAMGTNLQDQNLTSKDFGGKDGCNEYLVITKPEAVRKVHRSFLEVGCDAVETNTFGATRINLAEYGLEDQTREINEKAARLAKEVTRRYTTPNQPRFVAGSVGPGTRLPSLGHIGFDEMKSAYTEQMEGLIAGGVDALLIETCQDLLQTKIAVIAAGEVFEKLGKRLPLMAQVTFEQTGTMLLGTEMGAVIATLEMLPVDILGMNCATGPKEMADHLRFLCENSSKSVSAIPNAGLPENIGGVAHYKLSPAEFADYHELFVKEFGVNIVGGCCGTRPEHLKEALKRVRKCKPKKRSVQFEPSAASLYSSVTYKQEPPPLLIGEQTNANGSRKFKQTLEKNDYDGLVSIAREAVKEGAHMVDVSVAFVGRDEVQDASETMFRFNQHITAPMMIDSTDARVVEEALKRIGGKALINSINLEDGEERATHICKLARKYGAGLVALTIDEKGMAKKSEEKLAIAEKIYDLAVNRCGLKPEDLFFDTLTFAIGSGDPELRDAASETLKSIKLIKKKFPPVRTILGVSNISFGLSPHSRPLLNSVFLNEAIEAGLDAAIVHAKRIIPTFTIPKNEIELAKGLIYNTPIDGKDALEAYIKFFEKIRPKTEAEKPKKKPKNIEDVLKNKIIDGDSDNLGNDLEEALKKHSPIDIINNILLDGMKAVGDLFGAGKIQLPFVLKSAEVMKAAVTYLKPHMEKEKAGEPKGIMVLATVKGDVHDIGKNLVDIILTNNGYKVVNLGIKQPVESILKAAEEHKADCIGLSGLLVKSTRVMKEDLEEMNRRGIRLPVICGGAALTRQYVEDDLQGLYHGDVHYGQDAFSGLRMMEKITSPDWAEKCAKTSRVRGKKMEAVIEEEARKSQGSSDISFEHKIPRPPFWGYKILKNIRLEQIFPYVNKTALFIGQWQFRRGRLKINEFEKLLRDMAEPLFQEITQKCIREKILEPRVIYGFFPCYSEGNDLVVLDEDKKKESIRFTFLRQKKEPYYCISDFFRPKESGEFDVVAFQVVTVGSRATETAQQMFKKDRYSEYFHLHGLSVEAAEALAEYVHAMIRKDLGIAGQDAKSIEDIFKQGYQGSRYSFGYPACPNLEDQKKLFQILPAPKIGVFLTEESQLVPEQSTSAIVVYHPQAKYFSV